MDKEGEAGKQAKHAILVLPSDLAFENEEEEYMDDNRPLITQDSEISAHELTNLMTEAFFRESDDSDSDSYETQKGNHEAASYRTALTLLSSKEDALKSTLAQPHKPPRNLGDPAGDCGHDPDKGREVRGGHGRENGRRSLTPYQCQAGAREDPAPRREEKEMTEPHATRPTSSGRTFTKPWTKRSKQSSKQT